MISAFNRVCGWTVEAKVSGGWVTLRFIELSNYF